MASNINSKPRKPFRRVCGPVTVDCQCLTRPAYQSSTNNPSVAGVVLLNGKTYYLLPLGCSSADGFRLINTATGDCYDVDTSGDYPQCDCPDGTFRERPGGCKHAQVIYLLRQRGDI